MEGTDVAVADQSAFRRHRVGGDAGKRMEGTDVAVADQSTFRRHRVGGEGDKEDGGDGCRF
jgi:hypothetical protein